MRIALFVRVGSALACVFTTVLVLAQVQVIPPNQDPTFWGHAHEPYVLTLVETFTPVKGMSGPHTHATQETLYRNGAGQERTEGFYDNGGLATVMLRNPSQDSTAFLNVADKTALLLNTPRPNAPPPGKGWTVEQLPPRVIVGYPAEGQRFRRTISADSGGQEKSVVVVEDVWISKELGVVLQQIVTDPRIGKTTKLVTQLRRGEPDPDLFIIPSEYAVQKPATAGP